MRGVTRGTHLALMLVGCWSNLPHPTAALDNGAARTPPMGWLSWSRFRCHTDCESDPENCFSERLVRMVATRMVSDGYRDAGYTAVNLDSCWWDPLNPRDSAGHLVADRERFPSGLTTLAADLRAMGLQLGTYALMSGGESSRCQGPVYLEGASPTTKCPHWDMDVADLVAQNLSSIKVDSEEIAAVTAAFNQTYPALSDSLGSAGYRGVFTCSWPAYEMYHQWPIQYELMAKYCNTWRNFDDVQCNKLSVHNTRSCWDSVSSIRDYWGGHGHTHGDYDRFVAIAGPGQFNDADMLVVGNADHPFGGDSSSPLCNGPPGANLSCGTLTLDEEETQMGLWSIIASPLLMSNDPRLVSNASRAILLNPEVIAVSQDTLGLQGRPVLVPPPPPCPSCWVGALGRAWSDAQCANVGIPPEISTLTDCEAACLSESACNAFNFDNSTSPGPMGCVLRQCSSPFPTPAPSAYGPDWAAYRWNGGTRPAEVQLWSRPLVHGDFAVGVHNPGDGAVGNVRVNLTQWFAPDTQVKVRDLFRRADLGVAAAEVTVPQVAAHGIAMLRLSVAVEK